MADGVKVEAYSLALIGDAPGIADQILLRSGTELDHPFIYSSWLKSYRKSEFCKNFSNEIYFDGHKAVIARVLKRSSVIVAASKEDPSHIYGWACFERSSLPVLHFVYVKQHYRGLGLAKLLLSDLMDHPVVYSHESEFCRKLAQGSSFDPYQAFGRD